MSQLPRVLIVDDDAVTRLLLQTVLNTQYELTIASGCNEALDIVRQQPPFDLIVTDITMPDNSGIFLVNQVRLNGGTMPILVLSAMQAEQHVPAALAAGADDYLQKPADLKVLRKAVAELLERARRDKEQPRAKRPASGSSTAVNCLEDGSFVELTAVNDPSEANRFERFVERVLPSAITRADRDAIRLALEEIVQNAMEWGNRNDPSKQIRLSYFLMADRITFRVEDQGEGFKPQTLNDPSANPQQHIAQRMASGKRMGGWGIFMTRKVVDEVTFNPRGNVAFLTKFFSHVKPLEARTPETGNPA